MCLSDKMINNLLTFILYFNFLLKKSTGKNSFEIFFVVQFHRTSYQFGKDFQRFENCSCIFVVEENRIPFVSIYPYRRKKNMSARKEILTGILIEIKFSSQISTGEKQAKN